MYSGQATIHFLIYHFLVSPSDHFSGPNLYDPIKKKKSALVSVNFNQASLRGLVWPCTPSSAHKSHPQSSYGTSAGPIHNKRASREPQNLSAPSLLPEGNNRHQGFYHTGPTQEQV